MHLDLAAAAVADDDTPPQPQPPSLPPLSVPPQPWLLGSPVSLRYTPGYGFHSTADACPTAATHAAYAPPAPQAAPQAAHSRVADESKYHDPQHQNCIAGVQKEDQWAP